MLKPTIHAIHSYFSHCTSKREAIANSWFAVTYHVLVLTMELLLTWCFVFVHHKIPGIAFLNKHFIILQDWYFVSKTLAEREAFVYAAKTGLDVVTICPSLVFGPLMQPTVNSSSKIILKYFTGRVTICYLSFLPVCIQLYY
jgi:hypothetical protein